jgi:pyruvate/2-oxoglutarate/acetoin dehydrogenase E1 component
MCLQVIDLISLKPFDMETISNSIKKTRNAIIVEECMKTGGIGASLSAIINESLFDELDHQVPLCVRHMCATPLKTLALPGVPKPTSTSAVVAACA